MKLVYYRPPIGTNFGDELNTWLWPKLLGPFFDDDDKTLFIGIGSILNDAYPRDAKKIVMGTGFGSYDPPPVIDPTWDIRFVRGPQTAECLGLGQDKVITDGAVLVRAALPHGEEKRFRLSYMPHWESLIGGNWQLACKMAGLHMIDPRSPVEQVLREIGQSQVVMAEAMHGIIVADALRVPWIAATPNGWHHRFKWSDWMRSVGVEYRPQRVLPAGTAEWRRVYDQRRRRHLASVAKDAKHGNGRPSRARGVSKLRHVVEGCFATAAAATLWAGSRAEPMLSSDSTIEDLTSRALSEVEFLRRGFT